MSFLDREPFASFFGRGAASITVPVLDGAFRPNDVLEQASLVLDLPGADMVVSTQDRLVLSAGAAIYSLEGAAARLLHQFDHKVSALASHGNELAVGLETGDIFVIDQQGAARRLEHSAGRLSCPTALLLDANELVVAEGSSTNAPSAWSRDLLERNRTGRVVAINLASGSARIVATGVAFANGLARDPEGRIVYSQSWRHCLSRDKDVGERAGVLSGLPGYPSRLSGASDGGYWLCIFGMRTQLLEFVLREDKYRHRMLETVPAEYWIAPAMQSRENFLDPLQWGAVKQLGIKKPWAPPRSYGLLVKLSSEFEPEWSLHSRVGGQRHGITSACEWNGKLYAVSHGAGQLISVDHATAGREIVQ